MGLSSFSKLVIGVKCREREGTVREQQQCWESDPQVPLCPLYLSVAISHLAGGFQEGPEHRFEFPEHRESFRIASIVLV